MKAQVSLTSPRMDQGRQPFKRRRHVLPAVSQVQWGRFSYELVINGRILT